MAKKLEVKILMNRDNIAAATLGFTTIAITILAIVSVIQEPLEAKNILNIVLPVFASWVGTVLAFYFGRENFETANKQVGELIETSNKQVGELIQRLTPEQRAKKQVTSIMRGLGNMTVFTVQQEQSKQDIKISDLRNKFNNVNVSRLPIVDAEKNPLYMIHESKIDQYIAKGGKADDTLENFVSTPGVNFELNKGFVVVSENTSLSEAKRKMEEIPSCQDIFITKEGSPDEPLTGWISNVRMAKYLES